jgi:hypothetical protein
MSDLRLSTTELIETGAALRLLAGELRDAETIVKDNMSAVGHRGLADRLDEMQGSWDDRRNDLRDAIEGLGDVVKDAGQAFQDIEQHLVAALEGES